MTIALERWFDVCKYSAQYCTHNQRDTFKETPSYFILLESLMALCTTTNLVFSEGLRTKVTLPYI